MFVLIRNVEVIKIQLKKKLKLIKYSSDIVIQNKLEQLIASNQQPPTVTDYEPYRLLREMREQQDINENNLLHLRRRVIYPEGYLIVQKNAILFDHFSVHYRLQVIFHLYHIFILLIVDFNKRLVMILGEKILLIIGILSILNKELYVIDIYD
jgi:signal peptidase I